MPGLEQICLGIYSTDPNYTMIGEHFGVHTCNVFSERSLQIASHASSTLG